MKANIVEEHGSFLLIRSDRDDWAVVERRDGAIYPMHDASRSGEPDTPEGRAAAVAPDEWQTEAEARATFRDLEDRGEQLARKVW